MWARLVSEREERDEIGGEKLGRLTLGGRCTLKLGCGVHACEREERPTA
jgi:hypothetical protein